MRELTAGEITKKAIEILNTRNVEAWRQNNMTVPGRKNIVTKGIADVLGFNRSTGQLVACEVKKIGDTIKKDQHIFLSKVRKSGAMALIATQVNSEVVLLEYQCD
jgi:hypothetical protein